MAAINPCLIRSTNACGELLVRLGVQVLDDYLRFVAVRARPNTVLATAYDLVVFFRVVRTPTGGGEQRGCVAVHHRAAHWLGRARAACGGRTRGTGRRGRCAVACPASQGCSRICWRGGMSRSIPCRVGCPRGGNVSVHSRQCCWYARRGLCRRSSAPAEVDRLLAALRTHRDRAMVLGGLRRCEVLSLRCEDLRAAARQVFIAEGNGGHQRLIPVLRLGGRLSGWRTARRGRCRAGPHPSAPTAAYPCHTSDQSRYELGSHRRAAWSPQPGHDLALRENRQPPQVFLDLGEPWQHFRVYREHWAARTRFSELTRTCAQLRSTTGR